MRPQAIAVDLLIVLFGGLVLALLIGPFLHLLFGLPGGAEAEAGETWRFGLGTSLAATAIGPILAGMAWFSVRRHRSVHLDRGDPGWRPRRWLPYGAGVTLAATLVPVLGLQLLIWLVLGQVS